MPTPSSHDQLQIIGTRESSWLQREEAKARLHGFYNMQLRSVKRYLREWPTPRCYLSYLPEQAAPAKKIGQDLRDAGMLVIEHAEGVAKLSDFVIMLDTPAYQHAFQTSASIISSDIPLVRARLKNRRLISLTFSGKVGAHELKECTAGSLCDELHYLVTLFNLILDLYAIPPTDEKIASSRRTLHQQWEQIMEQISHAVDNQPNQSKPTVPAKKISREKTMSETYHDFELHVAPNGHTVANSPKGQAVTEISTTVPRTIQLALRLIENRDTDEKLLKEFGKDLYDWLLPGPIHAHFLNTESAAREKGANIRLRLRIEANNIASLPLEFFYREMGGYFLALNPHTPLSRYLEVQQPPKRIRLQKGPLHLLAIIADPTDQIRLDPDEWEDIIKQALAEPLESGLIKLHMVKRATRKGIRDALRQQKPNIIQFIGHGIYQDSKGFLALVDEDTGSTWLVNDETFANLYLGYDDYLGLISLATCESAKSDAPQGFLGIAPQLVQRGIPAVVSMQYKVYIKTAQVFLEDFYSAIAARMPADWAVQSARNAVAQKFKMDNREFATPVLYMRAKDGVILSRT